MKKLPDYTDPETGKMYMQISDAPFRDSNGQGYVCPHCDLQHKSGCTRQRGCIANKTVYKLKPAKKEKMKTFPDFTDPKTGIVYAQVPEPRDSSRLYFDSCCDGCYVKETPEGKCPDTTLCVQNHTIFVPKAPSNLVSGINALKAENEKLRAENQRIKDENKLLNAREHSAEEQVTMFKADKDAANKAVENLHASCSRMQDENSQLRIENKKLKSDKDAAESALIRLTTQAGSVQVELNNLRIVNNTLKEAVQDNNLASDRAYREREGMKAQIEAQVSEITSLRNGCAKIKGDLFTARQELKDLESMRMADQIAIKNLSINIAMLNSCKAATTSMFVVKPGANAEYISKLRKSLDRALQENEGLRAANHRQATAFQHDLDYAIAAQGSYEAAIKEQKDYAHKLECHLIEAAKENAELIKELDSYRCKKRGWFSKAPVDPDPSVLETLFKMQQEIVGLRETIEAQR